MMADHRAVFEKVRHDRQSQGTATVGIYLAATGADSVHLFAPGRGRGSTEALLKSGVTGLAYETIEVNRRLPLLEPMSEIAGRMSVLVGGYFLAKHNGGSGVLLGGVPGVLPGRVVVLGGGASGINAARMATGLGADVNYSATDFALPTSRLARSMWLSFTPLRL